MQLYRVDERQFAVVECPFCEIVGNQPRQTKPFWNLFDFSEIRSEILVETKNFVVIPDVSPITEGHVLIIPKPHLLSLASIDRDDLYDEFLEHVELLRCFYETYYSSDFLFFEHGSCGHAGIQRAGACITHAHLHMLPCARDLSDFIYKAVDWGVEDRLRALRAYRSHPYLMWGRDPSHLFVSVDTLYVSQFFRKWLFAEFYESRKFDWRYMLNRHEAYRSREKILRLKFKMDRFLACEPIDGSSSTGGESK